MTRLPFVIVIVVAIVVVIAIVIERPMEADPGFQASGNALAGAKRRRAAAVQDAIATPNNPHTSSSFS
jgi:hypothetical protein